jgi:DNA-binding response OmpR family regulator
MEAKKTILIIEDEPHIVLGLKDALEFEGFRVVTASAGKEGVALYRQERPNAVLLDAGADDYVTKPFSVGELVARIRALFRRTTRAPESPAFKIGSLTVNVSAHQLQKGSAKPVMLSFYEVELLRLLHERLGQPVSRDEILNKIWGVEANPTNRTVDNFIVKLRKKLEKHPENPEHILTVYGYGYKLVL